MADVDSQDEEDSVTESPGNNHNYKQLHIWNKPLIVQKIKVDGTLEHHSFYPFTISFTLFKIVALR